MFFNNHKKSPYMTEIEDLCDNLSKLPNGTTISVIQKGTKQIGWGDSIYDKNNNHVILYGTGALQKINTDDFVELLLVLFHEYHHITQYVDFNSGELPAEFFYAFVSRFYNYDYYYDNHDINILELEADYNAVFGTYNYLITHHTEINALECIKKSLKNKDAYKKYVSNIERVECIDQFDTLFDLYEKEILEQAKMLPNSKDNEFADYIDKYWYETGDNPRVDIFASSANNINLLCDKLVAAVVIELHPEYEELCIKNGVPVPKFEDVLLEIKGLTKEERDV